MPRIYGRWRVPGDPTRCIKEVWEPPEDCPICESNAKELVVLRRIANELDSFVNGSLGDSRKILLALGEWNAMKEKP